MTVKIIYDETDEIGVPESAVTIQGNTAFVYIVNNETAEKKDIKIGKEILVKFLFYQELTKVI